MAKGRSRLSLDLLRGFEAAARHQSLTRAAKELFVTQSAVSREVRTLEEQLGSQLFRRVHRGLKLTESGQLLYRAVGDAFKLIDQATDQLSGSKAAQQVTVTTVTSFAALWLVPRLSEFTSLHPDIEVRVAASNNILDLERERIDIGIRLFLAGTPPGGAVLLMKEKAFPVCAPAILQDRSRPLRSPEDLAQHVWLRFDSTRDDGSPWNDWPIWLRAVDMTSLKPVRTISFSHYDQTIQAALGAQGVAIGKSPLLSRFLRDRLLVAPFRDKAVSWGAYYVIVAPQAADRQPVKAFLTWLRSEVRKQS